MDLKIFYDKDIKENYLHDKKVAVIGYGSQGHAHALNLKDSEVDVVVGLSHNSKSREQALSENLQVMSIAGAVKCSDIIMMLVPDEVMADVYIEHIEPYLDNNKVLACAHGFNFHYKKIVPPKDIGVFMVAPKGPGHLLRREFKKGSGVPCLVATTGTNEKKSLNFAMSYAKAIGGARLGVLQTTFKEETETDLFGEQAVLCGGISNLIKAGYETLVENGYSPEMAYFECLHEAKLITDLIYEGGLAYMRYSISNTAEFGDYTSGPKIVSANVKEKMREVLTQIQNGKFADEWIEEHKKGKKNFLSIREEEKNHPMEEVGKYLRERMSITNSKK